MWSIRLGRGLEISCIKTPPRNHGKLLGVPSECLG
ncbi:BnaA01g23740D [Brassica napus]|uniref:BnaA01g23740D protein n=1 Tax=Brassica napus TaxID=3708 RepID=A0A078G0I1_BRANA|nr:BnaA01g23740D [Brassica napus]